MGNFSNPIIGLHPVFGPGEDRNIDGVMDPWYRSQLHPVFGPGEDRNLGLISGQVARVEAAPGLRTG